MKEKIIKFALNTVAFVVAFILAGSICRTIVDLFMFGYNLGH